MWSAASVNDPAVGLDFLEARDARQQQLHHLLSEAGNAASIVMISANIPGEEKHRPGVSRLLRGALASLQKTIGLNVQVSRKDVLGPYYLGSSNIPPLEAKRIAVAIESETSSARLLDVDVYCPDGSQVDRVRLGLPPRPCLVCDEPARECILLRRHSQQELLQRVDSLLEPFADFPRRITPEALAVALHEGALRELDLTPKPGLVDRHDNGAHPDLTYRVMRTSADLLPVYYEEILRCHRAKRPLQDFVQAGIEAEHRMTRAIHSNAHKGFIFLSGLVLMATCECDGRIDLLRQAISDTATAFFAHFGAQDSHGAGIRDRYGLGGIRAEAERGLPAIFEYGWPRYREALEADCSHERAGFHLLAVLMQQVEDTTAVRRCGLKGLSRLRLDGAHLQGILGQQDDPMPWLESLNREYTESGLTMGGVADCLALIFALQEAAD
jgi:triphosphoribosyl-dephospho-CoA synthase